MIVLRPLFAEEILMLKQQKNCAFDATLDNYTYSMLLGMLEKGLSFPKQQQQIKEKARLTSLS